MTNSAALGTLTHFLQTFISLASVLASSNRSGRERDVHALRHCETQMISLCDANMQNANPASHVITDACQIHIRRISGEPLGIPSALIDASQKDLLYIRGASQVLIKCIFDASILHFWCIYGVSLATNANSEVANCGRQCKPEHYITNQERQANSQNASQEGQIKFG